MLAALLPNNSAPIMRSRASSRRLTIAARRLPCISNRCMVAREEAVNAVSLPEKNAESKRQIRTMTSASQSSGVIVQPSFSARKARTSAASMSGAMQARPMPCARMKVSLPRLTFLS